MNTEFRSIILLVCFLSSFLSGKAQADLSRLLLEEGLRIPAGISSFQAVWFIPVEFWEQTWPEDLREEEKLVRQRTLTKLRDCVLIAAVPTVSAQFSAENLKLTVKGSGTLPSYSFLALDEDLQVFLDRIRPMVANVLENQPDKVFLGLFALPDMYKHQAEKAYEVVVRYLDESFEWIYPPTALLAPGVCPVDGKVLSPGWKFCPWHGNALNPISSQRAGE
ncbi:MAG: hypothetical protein GC205_07630 [Bacteroidetes bacterium]|nr:hypothetical protein [Bacteroidota bacterium]